MKEANFKKKIVQPSPEYFQRSYSQGMVSGRADMLLWMATITSQLSSSVLKGVKKTKKIPSPIYLSTTRKQQRNKWLLVYLSMN